MISAERPTSGTDPLEREFQVPAIWAYQKKMTPLTEGAVSEPRTFDESTRILPGTPWLK